MTHILTAERLPDIEIAPDWPGFDVTPTTRCCFDFYVQWKGVDRLRPYFGEFVSTVCEPPPDGDKRVYTIARWNSLLALYEHQQEAEDARDEADTMAQVRAAAHW